MPYLGGFKNPFRKEYIVVNLSDLKVFAAGEAVNTQTLAAHGLIRASQTKGMLKVLGNGKLDHALKVTAHKVSASAREAIEQAGGSVTLIAMRKTAEDEALGQDAAPSLSAKRPAHAAGYEPRRRVESLPSPPPRLSRPSGHVR